MKKIRNHLLRFVLVILLCGSFLPVQSVFADWYYPESGAGKGKTLDQVEAEIRSHNPASKYEAFDAIYLYMCKNYRYYQGEGTSSVESFVRNGYGDCWAETDFMCQMCLRFGIPAWWRWAAHEGGSLHRNAIANIDDVYYVSSFAPFYTDNNGYIYLPTYDRHNYQLASGWEYYGGKEDFYWHYFDQEGHLLTGWQKIDGKWYYLEPGTGIMATGWKMIGNTWYFFKSGGAMAASEWYGGYWFNADGSWTYPYTGSWKQNSTGWWFGDTSGWYARNAVIKIDNVLYSFDANGYWIQNPDIGSATVEVQAQTYTGKALKPPVTVKLGKTTLKKGTDYTVSYKNNTNVGTAMVTITGKGGYIGTLTKTFKIVPKTTSLTSVTGISKGFTAKWKKQATQTTGYQIQYSTNSKFASGNKTVTVKGNSTLNKTVNKLKAGTTYYVRVRTYKTVNGKNYYSKWSTAKTVKTKK